MLRESAPRNPRNPRPRQNPTRFTQGTSHASYTHAHQKTNSSLLLAVKSFSRLAAWPSFLSTTATLCHRGTEEENSPSDRQFRVLHRGVCIEHHAYCGRRETVIQRQRRFPASTSNPL